MEAYVHLKVYTNIYGSFVLAKKMEMAQMSINSWMETQWFIHTVGCCPAKKKNMLNPK